MCVSYPVPFSFAEMLGPCIILRLLFFVTHVSETSYFQQFGYTSQACVHMEVQLQISHGLFDFVGAYRYHLLYGIQNTYWHLHAALFAYVFTLTGRQLSYGCSISQALAMVAMFHVTLR